MLSVGLGEDLGPKGSWLLEVVVWMLVLVSADFTSDLVFVPGELWIFFWSVKGIWLIIWLSTIIAINSSSTISNIRSNSSSIRAINWNLFVVLSESVSVGVWIREKSALKHLIVGWLDTWHQVAWSESRLLDFGVIVLWVSVEGHLSNLVQWVVGVWPDLGDVEDVESVVLSILFWHKLDVPGP